MLTTDDTNKCSSIFYNSFANPFLMERLLLVIYAVIFVIGLVGNIMTIIIIKCNSHLRTPTNFYLLNLAVSDLMILMCNLPIEMIEIHYRRWPLSVVFCKLKSICAEFFTCSSILTILAFTCERYFAIVHPIHFHRLTHFRRAQNVIVIIWLISLLFSVPFGFLYEIEQNESTILLTLPATNHSKILQFNETISCQLCGPKQSVTKLLSIIIIITSICFFYFPMIVIGAIYLFIGRALNHVNKCENESHQNQTSLSSLSSYNNSGRKQTSSISCHSIITQKELTETKKSNTHLGSYSWLKTRARCQARRVVVKTLVAVVIAFFVCYAPLYLQRLLLALMNLKIHQMFESSIFTNVITYLYIISGTTYYFGSVINPILYNVVSNKYRRAFRNLICCRLTYQTKTITKTKKNLFQLNRSDNQPMQYFVKTSPIFQQQQQQQAVKMNTKLCTHLGPQQQQRIHETVPITKRPVLSSNPSSLSNSSSISSQNREPCKTYSIRSTASLPKKCQVEKNGRLSLRRKLLSHKQPRNALPWLATENKS